MQRSFCMFMLLLKRLYVTVVNGANSLDCLQKPVKVVANPHFAAYVIFGGVNLAVKGHIVALDNLVYCAPMLCRVGVEYLDVVGNGVAVGDDDCPVIVLVNA